MEKVGNSFPGLGRFNPLAKAGVPLLNCSRPPSSAHPNAKLVVL